MNISLPLLISCIFLILALIIFPLVVTGGIFWWIFSGIDIDNLKQAMLGISWKKETMCAHLER